MNQRNQDERRQEYAERCQQCARNAAQRIADKGSGGEDWTGSYLPNRDGIEELLVGQPVQILYQIGFQKREQDIAAAINQRANFKESQKQCRQTDSGYDATRRRDPNPP